jgi:ubiquitin-conjugating enzyme E2 S
MVSRDGLDNKTDTDFLYDVLQSLSSQVLRRLTREITKLQRTPPEGIGIEVGEQDMLDVHGWIQGPAGTPYHGGYFMVKFNFLGVDFPSSPPKCVMKTKIFHPNIHSSGEICVSTLKKDWSSKYGIEHILLVIKCLLITPNPDSALDAEAGRLLQDAYSEYAHTASVWTRIHASHCPPCFPSPKVSSSSTSISNKLDIGEGPSTTRPLTQSDSTNQSLSHKASFGGLTVPSVPLSSTTPNDGLQKRKSDEFTKPTPLVARKRQSVVKRGIKRL